MCSEHIVKIFETIVFNLILLRWIFIKQVRINKTYFIFLTGVGLVTRKMGNAVSPVVDLQKDGDEYTLNSVSTFKNIVLKFKPDVEFDQETPDGRKVKATITIDGNTLIETQKNADGSQTVINRTFTDDEVKMVHILNIKSLMTPLLWNYRFICYILVNINRNCLRTLRFD